jgi:hypothetical protein
MRLNEALEDETSSELRSMNYRVEVLCLSFENLFIDRNDCYIKDFETFFSSC